MFQKFYGWRHQIFVEHFNTDVISNNYVSIILRVPYIIIKIHAGQTEGTLGPLAVDSYVI